MKEELTQLIDRRWTALVAQGHLPQDTQPQMQIDRTRDKNHGDLASNIALPLAKAAGRSRRASSPRMICEALPEPRCWREPK